MRAGADGDPPVFVRLAADPIRWRLLRELGRSDRRVRELCDLIGQPQSLVSYHLGRLRDEHLVSMRRSSADGRSAYYRLDLARCRHLLTTTGGALHPGLRPHAPRLSGHAEGRRARVLFLCTGNSGRSQLGEALMERLGEGAIEVFSAGSHPKPLHPMALQVMREHGLDIAGRRSKRLEEFTGERFDYVISLCDRVREECPEFPGSPDVVHWSMPDPAREGDTDAERRQAFQRTFDELAARIPFLLQGIADSPLRQQEVK